MRRVRGQNVCFSTGLRMNALSLITVLSKNTMWHHMDGAKRRNKYLCFAECVLFLRFKLKFASSGDLEARVLFEPLGRAPL